MEYPSKFYSLFALALAFLCLNNTSPLKVNCLSLSASAVTSDIDIFSKRSKAVPIDTSFKLPSPLPSWPPGEGFGNGIIDLGGGLQVCQVTSFNKVWATHEGGPDNLGATFFEPSNLPQGFFMLGSYSQPNNRLLHGCVLVGKDTSGTNGLNNSSLKKPIDYTLVWSSENLKIRQDGIGYIWLPVAPDGYKAIGHVVTDSPNKPPLDKIYCVRSDITEQCETDTWIWGQGNGFNVFSLMPSTRGTTSLGVGAGTFSAKGPGVTSSLSCLKNVRSCLSYMPTVNQIKSLFQAYSPWIYFHPDEVFLPSSVDWYFTNGALLYKQDEESKPVPVEPNGSNLPQGGSNDGVYWLDLPIDATTKERVKQGNLTASQVYLHVKPMFGATFTDISVWIFYPFNGAAKAKVKFINISLGKIGEHVGDWEHLTLRISNFNGELWSIYFSEHSGGSWISASELEFQNGNKPVTYSSLHGHAMYAKAGTVVLGNGGIGIKNDVARSNMVLDTGASFLIVGADYLGKIIVEPPWLNYFRKWGPKITYDIEEEIKKVEKALPGPLKSAFEKSVRGIPSEVLGEDGPTGPKVKGNWNGDEV